MPLNPILIVEIFDVWASISWNLSQTPSGFCIFWLLWTVSKWVEAVACKTNDHRVVVKF
jgi:hypothetical protein